MEPCFLLKRHLFTGKIALFSCFYVKQYAVQCFKTGSTNSRMTYLYNFTNSTNGRISV